jgi:tRNA-binding EMAP/Myf-like protein
LRLPISVTSVSTSNEESLLTLVDLDTIELPGYIFKTKNRKKIGRISGGMILAYKESLENYIELLDIESKYVLWFIIL